MLSIYDYSTQFFRDIPNFKDAFSKTFLLIILGNLIALVANVLGLPELYGLLACWAGMLLPGFIWRRYHQQKAETKLCKTSHKRRELL